jgi:small subunit ribosomal protein S17
MSDENNETVEEPVADTSEAPEVEEATADVSDTTETPEAEETPAAAEVSDTTETPEVEETPAEVSDTSETPAAAEVSDTTETPEVEETPAEVSDTGKTRSRRHVPRAQRRQRTKVAREQAKTRKPITRTEKPEAERGRRQERRGVVVSDKADKTIVVKVDVIRSHPRYKKVVRRSVKFHAHDEQNTAGVGDTVRIVETRPLSKQKRWRLAEIVEKAK